MLIRPDIEFYLEVMVSAGLYTLSKENLRFQLGVLFKGVDFRNARVIDIGSGNCLYGLYMAYMGAKEVICLEPEAQGSTSGANNKFDSIRKSLQLDNIILKPIAIEEFEPDTRKFDVILLYNSINHLNETACINLLRDRNARMIYERVISKISYIANPGARLIVSDCSRNNFFALLRIKNPFVPTIEWHKHHSPEVWVKLFEDAGFVSPKITWNSFNRLRNFGRVMLGNRLASYFLASQFTLRMRKA